MTEDQRTKYEMAKRYAATAWAVVGCAVVFVLAVRAVGLVWPAVELMLVGVILGFICSPLTNTLARHHVPRSLAALIALLVVVAVLAALFAALLPPVLQQSLELLRRVPSFVMQGQAALNHFWAEFGSSDNADMQGFVNQLAQSLGSEGTELASRAVDTLSSGVVTNLIGSVEHLTSFFLGMVLAYWLAKDYPVIVRELGVISGPKHERNFTLVLAVMSRSMGGYMRSICFTSLICGVASFAALALVGHPYAGLASVLIGVLHFIPVIGAWGSVILAAALGLIASPMVALETLALTIVIINVADNVVGPVIMQSAVNVHPALSLVGIMIGGALGGILGMLLAVPLTAAIRSVFVYYFEARTGRQLVSREGAFFKSTPFRDERGNVEPSFDALDDDRFFEDSLLVQGREACSCGERPASKTEGAPGGPAEDARRHDASGSGE